MASAAPDQSGGGRSSLALSGTNSQPSRIAPAAIGTLSRKMNGQPSPSTSQPPSKGEIAPAIAPAAAQVPTARPFASPAKEALKMARLLGSSIAAPSPCSARPPRKISRLGAAAHSREARVNRRMPPEHHPLAPVKIARRAAGQQQGGERQGEGVHHPLHLGRGGVEAPPDRRQRDVQHRAVDEGEARGEDAGGEDRPRIFRLAARRPQAGRAVARAGQAEAQVTRLPPPAAAPRSCARRGPVRPAAWR